jgi:hypothetical protein
VAAPVSDTQAEPEVTTEVEKKSFTQDELNEIIQKEKAKAEAKAERRAMKAYRETLERFAPAPQPQAPADNGRPTQANFANVDDYVEAMSDWKFGQRDQQAQQARYQQQARSIETKTEGFYAEAAKIPGFDREAFDELPLTAPIAAAIIESGTPAKLMAHLAANPNEAQRIAELNPSRQAEEIGKLETKLASAPKVSSAPSPIKPIGTRGSATNQDTSKMGMEDYAAFRKTQGARWAR